MARVLVVDDDEGVRSFLVDALALDGHVVHAAADGASALRLVGNAEVVVTDVKMPGVDGMALLARLRAEHPQLPVVLLTAHGSVELAVEAMRHGAFDFLQKPIPSPAALREVVRRAAARGQVPGPVELTWGAPAMRAAVDVLRRVAVTDTTVLLLGESGVGKEVAAHAVHGWSRRAAGPFVAVNCAALSETLLESELFGHERGAFTGAVARKRGRLELAAGGTFFLDEVGELRPALQARLLRVLQERTFERVGGTQTVEADVRWVAATNRDLQREAREGRFREDLYYRLAVFPVTIPPLRERREDVVPLARAILHRVARELGRPGLAFADEAGLARRDWPGNVRELANAIERAAILADGDLVYLDGNEPRRSARNLEDLERGAIVDALAATGGHRRLAAEKLGIGERTLYEKIRRYGL